MWHEVCQDVKNFETCLNKAKSQAAKPPPQEHEFASYPTQKCSADLFHFFGVTWLILVDWFSRFSFAKALGRTGGTDRVIHKMQHFFFNWDFVRSSAQIMARNSKILFKDGRRERV